MKILGFIFSIFLAACGSDIKAGTQSVGQQCFFPSDCVEGLSCYNRVCAPIGGAINQPDMDNGIDFVGHDWGMSKPDLPPQECKKGESRCRTQSILLTCSNGKWVENMCHGESCINGDCFNIQPCEDGDGDGYGRGCDKLDCDDTNAQVNPSMKENCDTPYDDNCDGEINENCEMKCCAGGCPNNTFCTNECVCEKIDPATCTYQDQPCVNEGQENNGFICSKFGENSPLRCLGICRKGNETCPESESICVFQQANDRVGVCVNTCQFNTGCRTGSGCLPWGKSPKEGICVPNNPDNKIGLSCNSNITFDCEAGAICIDLQRATGKCVEACRPFAHGPGVNSDCNTGHCLAFTSDIGMCTPDNIASEGEQCDPRNTTCGEDTVLCEGGARNLECTRACRPSLGDADCLHNNKTCIPSSRSRDLGACK